MMEWLFRHLDLAALGFIGAGLSVGVRLSRGEKPNRWAVYTTLSAGLTFGGTCTEALVRTAGLEPFWAGAVALLMGVMAMGFLLNVMDGKVPVINRLMETLGMGKDDAKHG